MLTTICVYCIILFYILYLTHHSILLVYSLLYILHVIYTYHYIHILISLLIPYYPFFSTPTFLTPIIDIPDTGLLCDLLWADPDKEIVGWGENDRGVSFTFGEDVVAQFLRRHDLDLICRAHQVVEDGE